MNEYVHKTVALKFYGKTLQLATSQELFSSFAVDAGSSLLLQSIGKHIPLDTIKSVLDVGCGVGTLGLAIKAQNSGIEVDFVDRDALALNFTEYNCRQNKLPASRYIGSLGVSHLSDKKYDLIVSNIPAKAGNPVIECMLKNFSAFLTAGGTVAIVIVKTLSDFVSQVIIHNGGHILFKNITKEYTVYHYNGIKSDGVDDSLTPYIRGVFDFKKNGICYNLHSVYGLHEFDTLGFDSELGMKILSQMSVHGKILVINPGQGHIPVYLLLSRQNRIDQINIAGRDLLSLVITENNIKDNTGQTVNYFHIPYIRQLEGKFDFIYFNYKKEAIENAHIILMRNLPRLLNDTGELVLIGKSSFVFHFDTAAGNIFLKTMDKKYNGFRGIRYTLKNK